MNEIAFTQGDTPLLLLTCQGGNGIPTNITGASFSTQMLGPQGVPVVFPNSQHTIVSAVAGQVQLQLSSGNTQAVAAGPNKDIIMTVTIGSKIITYRGKGILTVFPAVPKQ